MLTIIFGMVSFQAGWLIAGIALIRVVYIDKWHFIPENLAAPLGLLAAFSLVLLGSGVAKGRAIARDLEKEKVVRDRLLKVKADSSGSNMRYQTSFAYIDAAGAQQSLQIERQRNDLALGDEVLILVNEQTGEGLVELDLPGGTTFADFQGNRPIEPKVLLRILVIPVLALTPLLGLVPSVAMALQHLAASTSMDMYGVCGWSVTAQFIWLFVNRRYFTLKATNIGRCCPRQT